MCRRGSGWLLAHVVDVCHGGRGAPGRWWVVGPVCCKQCRRPLAVRSGLGTVKKNAQLGEKRPPAELVPSSRALSSQTPLLKKLVIWIHIHLNVPSQYSCCQRKTSPHSNSSGSMVAVSPCRIIAPQYFSACLLLQTVNGTTFSSRARKHTS